MAPIFRPSLISLICCFHHFPSFSIIFHHFPSFSIIFHHFPSFSITFHHFPSFSITFHHFPSLSITFHHFPSFSIIFHHFPSFSIIFHLPTFSSCFFLNVEADVEFFLQICPWDDPKLTWNFRSSRIFVPLDIVWKFMEYPLVN